MPSRKYANLCTSFADADPAFSWAWRGLVACYLFERPQASVVRDVVTGHAAFFTAGSSGTKPAWGVDSTGAHVVPVDAGDSSGIILTDHPILGDNFTPETLTMEMWVINATDRNVDPRCISKQSGGAAADHDWMLGITDAAGGDQSWRARISTGGSTTTTVTNPITSGLSHIIARYNGVETAFWQNGLGFGIAAGGPQTGTVDATAGMPIKIGNSAYSGAANEWDSPIYKIAIYNRALTLWEIKTLARDPMRPFQRGPGFDVDVIAAITAALTGTVVPTVTEALIVAG